MAVTEPGAVTRQSRPVYEPPRAPEPSAIPIERSAAPPVRNTVAAAGGAGVLLGAMALLVALLTLGMVVYVLNRPGEPTDRPIPAAPVTPAPKPEAPAPKPDSTAPKPEAPAPEPDSTAPNPEVPAPKPDSTAPKPETDASVAAEPAHSSSTDCVNADPAVLNSSGTKVIFRARPCEGSAADYPDNTIVVHYRLPGKGYLKQTLPVRGGTWVWGLPVTDAYREQGLEYYIDGWGGSRGTASAPEVLTF